MKDVAQDVAEDVFDAAKNGNAKVLIVKVPILPIATCQLRTHAQHACAHASCRCWTWDMFILSIVICPRRKPRHTCS